MTIAVIKTGGKQYVVSEEKQLKIEKILGEKGDQVMFDEVLLVSDLEGKDLQVGQPLISKKVSAEILEQGRSRKVRVAHYKSKTRQYKVRGHRQSFTKVKITKIGSESAKAKVTGTKEVKKVTKPTVKKKTVK